MNVRRVAFQTVPTNKVIQERQQGIRDTFTTPHIQTNISAPFETNTSTYPLEVQARLNMQAVSFGYKSILKTYWLKDLMPTVKFDMGGNFLTKKNVTLGHMLPHSKGGHTSICNLMLETKGYNMSKGNLHFSRFFDEDAFDMYCKQFEEIKLPDFNGRDYIEKITRTAKRLLRERK